VPANHGLGANDHEMILPSRPEEGERNPERSTERGEPRPTGLMGVGRELLTESKLNDGLFLATPEEGEETVE